MSAQSALSAKIWAGAPMEQSVGESTAAVAPAHPGALQWFVEPGPKKPILTQCRIISARDGLGPVAFVARDYARLIATAPDLLEACLAMVEWDAREQDHAVDFNARMALCRDAFDKARAAIANAGGAA